MKCPDCDFQVTDTGDVAYDFLAFLLDHANQHHRVPNVDGWDQRPVYVECRQCGSTDDLVDIRGNDICVSCYEENGERFANND